MSRERWRLGLTDEVPVLLTAALILLVVVSVFTLGAYRSGLALLADEQREQAVALAEFVAARVSERSLPAGEDLRRWAPGAGRASILAPDGSVLVSSRRAGAQEEQSLGPLPESLVEALAVQSGVGIGPGPGLPDAFVGFAAVPGDRGLVARVDLAAGMLAAQLRGVRLLTGVVLAVDFAVVVLLLVFLRRLLGPLERLLTRARQLQPPGGEGDAEISDLKALVETLERGLAALAAPGTDSADDEIAALSRTLGGSLESGVLLVDDAGRLVAINRLGSDLLGIAPAAGRPVAEALAAHPELAGLLAVAVAADQGISRRELVLATPARRLDLGLTVHALRRDDGRSRGYLALFADLTESRRRAEEARLADRLASLGELVAGVAHELRNSLGTLRGYLGLVERAPDGELRADYLGEIRRETDHLQRVLEDFLSFARPGTVRPEPVDLLAVARRAARDPGLAGAAIAVEDLRAAPLALRSDGQLLERALRNLLHNAVQAAGAGEPVSMTLAGSDAGVEIAIEDRGPGLPAEVRERLFQPFAPGRPGGVGLGLALAHRIVTLLGGRLSLGDRPGGGTRAVLWFPHGGFVTDGNPTSSSEAGQDPLGEPRTPADPAS